MSALPPNSHDLRTIALTGGTGLIGERLTGLLHQSGVHLRILTRRRPLPMNHVTFIHGELTNTAAIQELVHTADAVVHLGGIAHTSLRTDAERAHAREINVGGTIRVLEAAQAAHVRRVIVASTAHVYAGQQGIGLTEDAPVAGDSFYAALKLEAEAAAQLAVAQGLDVVIIRPCIVYGPGVRFNLASLMQAVRRGIYFHASGTDPIRSFASVDTVAAAIVHLLHAGVSGRAYNIADRQPVHLSAWIDDLARRMNTRKPRTLPMPLLRTAAALLDPIAKLGLPAPLTTEKLAKLTASFSLDVSALAATGFLWPGTENDVLNAMVQTADSPR
jgi:nucleoside-diphosphate-sugar epimerase